MTCHFFGSVKHPLCGVYVCELQRLTIDWNYIVALIGDSGSELC